MQNIRYCMNNTLYTIYYSPYIILYYIYYRLYFRLYIMYSRSLNRFKYILTRNYVSIIESNVHDLGYRLPKPPKPMGSYSPLIEIDNIAYISGHLPIDNNGKLITGTINKYLTHEQGQEAAVICGLNILSTLKQHVGLDKISKVIKYFN